MSLEWGIERNLENSLKDMLDKAISDEVISDLKGTAIPIYIKEQLDENWTLPCITVGLESETNPPLEIGSTKTLDTYLIICDIYATNGGERQDLAQWLKQKLESGFEFREYKANSSNPTEATFEVDGWVKVRFLSNGRVNLGENSSDIDKYRHRISINVQIQ